MTGRNSFTKWALGGWQWSGVWTATSGNALTILAGTDRSKTNLGADRADFVGSASQYGGTAPAASRTPCTGSQACIPWLNDSLFANPAVGTFGNTGKNIFRGPRHWNVDVGLHKTFYPMTSHETLSVQLRGEFFNLFNHAQLGDPNTSFSSGNFGQVRGTAGGSADYRIIQLALKLFF